MRGSWVTSRVVRYEKIQEEFASSQYLKLEHFHVLAQFFRVSRGRVGATQFSVMLPENQYHLQERGRCLMVEVGEYEYYAAGTGVGLNFYRRPDPEDDDPWALLASPAVHAAESPVH